MVDVSLQRFAAVPVTVSDLVHLDDTPKSNHRYPRKRNAAAVISGKVMADQLRQVPRLLPLEQKQHHTFCFLAMAELCPSLAPEKCLLL